MNIDEFVTQIETLIFDEKFDEAEALMKDHAVVLSEDLVDDAFQSQVVFSGNKPLPQNQPEAAMAIGLFTGLSRKRRNAIYRSRLRDDPDQLRIVEEGDSWHQFPVFIRDLVDQVAETYAVYSLGYPGDTIENMVTHGEYLTAIVEQKADVFMFSGGGNDILGRGRFVKLLNEYYDGASAEDLINKAALDQSLEAVLRGYHKIISRALAAKPDLHIFLHGYDNAIPLENGRSLGRPLARKRIPLEIGREIVKLILKRFNAELSALAIQSGSRVHHFDLRTLVGDTKSSWFNELHPRSAGFERCAAPILDRLATLAAARASDTDSAIVGVAEAAGLQVPRSATKNSASPYLRLQNMADRIGRQPIAVRPPLPEFEMEKRLAEQEFHGLMANLETPESTERIEARLDYSLRPVGSRHEAVFGTPDFDPFYILPRGVEVAKAVARIHARSPDGATGYGTGFLIGRNLLMTNNHVLPSRDMAVISLASFGYHENVDGTFNPPSHFRLTDEVFVTSVSHDYSIVSVEETNADGATLSEFGHIDILPRSGKALKAENVNIIQHPGGDYKKVAQRKNYVVGRARQYLYYVTDTLPGTSGAPVFNTEWQLVALHHMAIADPDAPDTYRANRGVRISAIVDDLTRQRNLGHVDAHLVDKTLFQLRLERAAAPARAVDEAEDTNRIAPAPTDDNDDGWAEVFETANFPIEGQFETARPQLPATAARWPSSPRNAPDTWHLPGDHAQSPFSLNATVLRDLVSAGRFEPEVGTHGRLIFALRGCRLTSGAARVENVEDVALTPAEVDHENTRCVIGVWNRSTGRISAYAGSTVPRRTEMLRYYNKVNFGTSRVNCNMLPTGCYEYCVGSHFSRRNGEVKYVLRQGNGPLPANASTVTTLRTFNDLIYGTQDFWDTAKPGDNIHPAFRSSSFSSQGCLTLPGTQSGGGASHTTGTGEWRRFRAAAGFDGQRHGERYDVLLVTGHEASAIAHLQADNATVDQLACLRHGSRGAEVSRLQHALGLTADDAFGPITKKALSDYQSAKLGYATGTYGPEMAALLGFTFWPGGAEATNGVFPSVSATDSHL